MQCKVSGIVSECLYLLHENYCKKQRHFFKQLLKEIWTVSIICPLNTFLTSKGTSKGPGSGWFTSEWFVYVTEL